MSSVPPIAGGRLLLYVGKGGVGKTTVAAASAARAAALGHNVLAVSTDIAHSLGDVLDASLSHEPCAVAPNLWAQEINVLEEARRSWGKVQAQVSDLLRREGIPDVQADELAILPGMEEIAALVQVARQLRDGRFDCIVVDAAPTGETIRLLSMPETFRWYAGRLMAWRGRLNRFARGLLSNAFSELNILDLFDDLSDRVRALRRVLTDPERSSYRIVTTADRTVLKEARRAETYLNLFGYPVDAVVLNRLLPEGPSGAPFLDALIARQATIAADVHGAFAPLPILSAPLLAQEPLGVPALAKLGEALFGAVDPVAVLHRGATQTIERTTEGYLLRLPLPNVEANRLALSKRGDELYVEVGNVRREIALPNTLAALRPGRARMRGGVLEIPFAASTG